MNKDRKRNRAIYKPKRVILVSYEGDNKTERYYFNGFSSRNNNYIIRTVPGNETDPVSLVRQTIKEISKLGLNFNKGDKAFCIFDTDTKPDKNKQILEAVRLAKKHKIEVITSSPSIEIWFLLHYEYTTAQMTVEETIEKIRNHYPNYDKNCDMYSVLKDKTDIAYQRAKKLEKHQLDIGNRIQTVEANPHTEIYKVIDEINGDIE